VNVVLICIDTLRSDHLGTYGYEANPTTPRLDEFAEQSIVFEDVWATSGWTKPSVPSFLTGTMPAQHGVYEGSARARVGAVTDVLPERAETLAERFSEAGYQTAAFVKNAQLRRGNGFEQGFDLYLDEAGDAREIRWQAMDWIDTRDPKRPFFLYLHLLDVHWPYPVPEEYATRFASEEDIQRFRGGESRELRDAINDGDVPFADSDRRALENLYDGALSYVDEQLGQLLQSLDERALGPATVVSVISDHGEEFGEHGRIGHGHGLYENLLQVPWILRVPGRAPMRHAAPASLLDLFPTLLAAVGLPPGELTVGVDRLSRPAHFTPLMAEHKAPDKYLQALRSEHTKITRTFRPPAKIVEGPVRFLLRGSRWEAAVQRDGYDRHFAVRLRPRDEDEDEPVEVKGPYSQRADGSFSVGTIAARLEEDADVIRTSGAEDTELRDGRMVKARGFFRASGFLVDRLKVYPTDQEIEFEVRGPVVSLEAVDAGAWDLDLGGWVVRVDARTTIEDPPEAGPTRMDREEVLRALDLGSRAADAGFAVESALSRLPEETPLEDPGQLERLDRLLDDTAEALAAARFFEDGDRVELTPQVIEELRALGYVR